MAGFSDTLRRFATPPVAIGITAALAAIATGAVFVLSAPHAAGSYVSPERGTLVEEVSATGTVKPAESVELSFEAGGRIAWVSAPVGSHVGAGATLAALAGADAAAQLEQAKAALAVQEARLVSLRAGAKAEDIAVAETAVSGANSSLSQARLASIAAARDAYVKSDDAVHNRIDQFISNPRTPSPALPFPVSDDQLRASFLADRVAIEGLLKSWSAAVAADQAAGAGADTGAALALARANLARVGAFLDEAADILTKAIPATSYPTASIQGFQASVASARASVSGSISALDAASAGEAAASSALASANSQLAFKKSPAASADIAAQEAQVAAARAAVDLAAAQAGKTILTAPFSGTVTKNDAHPGASALPGAPLISLISDARFQIEAYVSEADLAKIKRGEDASVKLDAYPEAEPLSARVVAIDPASTVQGGIPAYKVTLQLSSKDDRVRDGLTANVSIRTAVREEALSVPSSAVIRRADGFYVLRREASGDQLVKVSVGVETSAGRTEILSGLSEADRVRAFGSES